MVVLVLYKQGPPFYHASYSVVVKLVDGDLYQTCDMSLSWTSFAALNRVTQHVAKVTAASQSLQLLISSYFYTFHRLC